MTVVGKILVFLNLVFSLVVGGFAIVDYTARTHWAEAYAKVKEQNDKLRSSAESFKRDSDLLAKEKTDLYERLNAERVVIDPAAKDDKDSGFRVASNALTALKERSKTIDELKQQVDELRKELVKQKGETTRLLAMEQTYKTDNSRRQADTQLLRNTLKSEMDKSFKLEQEKNQMRDDMVTAQIAAKTLKDRNSQLENQLQELARSLAQAKANLGATGVATRGANPPAENIEGQVTKAEGNLVSISVGSDNGLSKSQTMEIFRLGVTPDYIGRIRLVEVSAKGAVGQFVNKPRKAPQVGDRVASRILGGS
ncbi:MAG: hypothetical protein U0840_23515 [Gemmataceae bacterium]